MPEQREPPDIYCDGAQVMVSPFHLALRLTESHPEVPTPGKAPKEPETVAWVRTSLEHAKILAIMLRKALKQHEDAQGGPINIHPGVTQQLGISPKEDW